MLHLLHSLALLSLTLVALTSCAGPKATSSRETKTTKAIAAPIPANATPAAAAEPPPDPMAARDAYWNLAMKHYVPPAKGPQPAATIELSEPGTTITDTAKASLPTLSTAPSMSKPATGVQPAPDINPADIPFAAWAPGKRGIVKSPYDPAGRLIDVRDFNAGQLSQCPYTGKIFRVPPVK